MNGVDVLSRTIVAFLVARCAEWHGLTLRGAVGAAGAQGLAVE